MAAKNENFETEKASSSLRPATDEDGWIDGPSIDEDTNEPIVQVKIIHALLEKNNKNSFTCQIIFKIFQEAAKQVLQLYNQQSGSDHYWFILKVFFHVYFDIFKMKAKVTMTQHEGTKICSKMRSSAIVLMATIKRKNSSLLDLSLKIKFGISIFCSFLVECGLNILLVGQFRKGQWKKVGQNAIIVPFVI
jgi:hypothetical protein